MSTRPHAPRSLRRGMTLMELMVAVSITGMMTAAGYGAFASIIDHRRALRDATVRLERAAALRETIDGWLATGRIVQQLGGVPGGGANGGRTSTNPGPDMIGQQSNVASSAVSAGQDEEVSFTTTALTPALAPNTRVRLYIDADENTPERGLAIEYQTGTLAQMRRMELDSTITEMTVEFLDNATQQWNRPSEGLGRQRAAVRLTFASGTLTTADSLPSILRLPIVRALVDPATLVGNLQNATAR